MTAYAVNSYITADDIKATLILDGTTFADDDIERAVNAANAAVDQLFGRPFVHDVNEDGEPVPTDRHYSVRRRSREIVGIRDLTRLTPIEISIDLAGDGTFSTNLVENTDYYLEPLNAELDGKPFEQIRAVNGLFPAGTRILRITGTYGWPTDPPPQLIAFAEILAVKFVERIRSAPLGVITAGADMGVAMRLGKLDPDFPTLAAGLARGALIS